MTRKEYVKRKLSEKQVSWVDTFIDSMYPKKMSENYLKNNTQVIEKKSEKYNNNNKKVV